MFELHDMTEMDKLFFFLNDLSHDAEIELQRRRVSNLADAVTVVKCLSDYDIGFPTSMKTQGSASHSSSGSGGQSSRGSKSKSGGASNGSGPNTPNSSSSRVSNNSGRPKLSCFICRGPHKFAECSQKIALTAMKLQEEAQGGKKGCEDGSEEED